MLILRNPLLDAFEAICDLGTAHSAAKHLGVTQTAITQRIKNLETGLGMTLFLRSRRGMSLTDEGKALLHYCKGSRDLEGQFTSFVRGQQRSEVSLTLIGPTSAISTRILDNIKGLYLKYPFLRLHLRSDDNLRTIELLKRGEADLGIVPPDVVPNEMQSKRLKPDRYLLVATSKWKGRKLKELLLEERIIDFYESDPTTRNYLKTFDLSDVPLRERIFVNQNEALIRLFQAGVGFGTLTEAVAKPYLEDGSLIALNRGMAMEDPLALVWYPRPGKMDYFEALIAAFR